jgi:hypothetical protein
LGKNPGDSLKKTIGMGKTGKLAFFAKYMFKRHVNTLANT